MWPGHVVDRFCHSESRAFHVLLAQFFFIIKPSGTAAPTGRVNLINLLMFGGVEVHAPPALTGSHGSQFEHPDRTFLERYTHRFTFKCLCCCLTLSLCLSPVRPRRRFSPALTSRLQSRPWPKLPLEPLDRATASLPLPPKTGILGTLQVREQM